MDCSVLESILGSPCFGKLPYRVTGKENESYNFRLRVRGCRGGRRGKEGTRELLKSVILAVRASQGKKERVTSRRWRSIGGMKNGK